jgi:tetratricopeptide (TPR) repeat protein
MKKLSTTYQILLIIATALAVYYPTNFAEICLVDDYGVMLYFFSEETFSLKDIFFPHSAGGGYYRPLIMLSYILDKQLWFLHERLMHFESVVAHLVNSIFVFYVCREAVYLHLKKRDTYIPLAAALLFALHPIMTESVNWISGRTDIMMGTFVLVSVLCLLRYVQNKSKLLLAGAIFSAFTACLAKEAAFGYLIGSPLLAIYKVGEVSITVSYSNFNKVRLYIYYYSGAFLAALLLGSYWLVLGIALLYLVHIIYRKIKVDNIVLSIKKIVTWSAISITSIALASGLFIFVRTFVFTSSVSKIGQTVTLMLADLNYTISLFLGAVGFYVKKFFFPLPLNFFILEIDPLYDFVGIAVLLFVCHIFISKKLPATMTLVGFLLLLPALPFAFSTIAWTAYAERYIYLPSAFWIIALFLWGGAWLERNPTKKQLVTTLIVILCLISAGVTFWRNIVWQSNVTLMRDTVAQTPRIRKLRNIYIKALIDKGETGEALKQYQLAAVEVPSPAGDEQAALFVGGKLISEHRYNEALTLYQDALQRTQFKSEPIVTASIGLVRVMLTVDTISEKERERLAELLKKYSDVLEEIKRVK